MPYFKNLPKFPIATFSDEDSFLNKYKVTVRRASTSFLDHLHYHEFLAIWYVLSGEFHMSLNGEKLKCPAGSVLCTLPYSVHAMDTQNLNMDEVTIISISSPADALYKKGVPFHPLTFQLADYNGKSFPLYIRLDGRDKKLADELFSDILNEYTKKSEMHITRIFRNLDEFLKLCSEKHGAQFSPAKLSALRCRAEKILITVKNMKKNFTSPLSIDEAADFVNLPRRSFTKAFREVTGFSYHDMIMALKTFEAIKLLKYTSKSISEIACECGFADNAHFTRICQSFTNLSPLNLRKEMIEVAREKEADSKRLEALHSWESHLDAETRKEHRANATGKSF
ncbi:MAG: helix-turn-helix domain-containing protein [Ruminococcaceae bacterium]|nr:helix-turn-helix domain-containing protein [Oscillospiraceae bacterium]